MKRAGQQDACVVERRPHRLNLAAIVVDAAAE
jgi:hypothetical protein